MKNEIIKQLNALEEKENVTILHAIESGSRAWGFESTDSDYDVRFIYLRDKTHYLRLDKQRDVIELPLSDILDINGWDLDKTLKLLHHSNPTLFEWCNSPIIYKTTPFFNKIQALTADYFNARASLHHYLNMATGNYRDYLKQDFVKAKKYFYVLRPILACRWILAYKCPPPMRFSELCESMLPNHLKPTINELLDIKMKTPEITEVPKVTILNIYIEENLSELNEIILSLPKEVSPDFNQLNTLFLEALEIK